MNMGGPAWFRAATTTTCPPHLIDGDVQDYNRYVCVRCGARFIVGPIPPLLVKDQPWWRRVIRVGKPKERAG